MKNRNEIILEKILKYVGQIKEAQEEYGKTFESFESSSVFRNACCMCILQIGELCKALTMDFRNENKQIPWKEWCGIRDVFAHQYAEMDMSVAWSTIEDDVPELEKGIKEILKSLCKK